MAARKSYMPIFLIISIIILSGCIPKIGGKSSKSGDGISISFLPNSPQDKYVVSDEDEEPIMMIIELRNRGSYPQEDEFNELSRGNLYISGFDRTIISLDDNSARLNSQALTGISPINPEGGFDTVEFKGSIFGQDITVDKYTPTLLATLCYPYTTKSSPTICIDPFPFDDKQKKVCKIGSQAFKSQGAPVTIMKIDQEASTSKIQFKISLKNTGKGDIIDFNALDRCNPMEGQALERKDFDKIQLVRATAGFSELTCGPFAEGDGIIRMHNGEGFVICSIDKESYENAKTAYTTPLNLEFRYGYRITALKPVTISKITSTG